MVINDLDIDMVDLTEDYKFSLLNTKIGCILLLL